MAYTVKQVSAMSGVSVRALHFYDETGLLKPAYLSGAGYRHYEEPQLLTLQQILFYRELGFELKQIKQILGSGSFEKAAALKLHRKTLLKNLSRTQKLMETIDKTIQHLKGKRKMKSKELFAGFSVGAGKGRFGEAIRLGGEPNDCKVSSQDTEGAMAVFEFTGRSGGPRHLHLDQEEWIYVIEGELEMLLGEKQIRLRAGESVFVPRKVNHAWVSLHENPCKIINVYHPAGRMEEFFREISGHKGLITKEELTDKSYTEEKVKAMRGLFEAHGMEMTGPPLGFE